MSFEKYKRAWKNKLHADRLRLEKKRRDAHKTAVRLSEMLVKDFHARRVVLLGSTLREGEYRENSDIDLAVGGIKSRLFYKACGACLMKSSYPVDLIDIGNASSLMKKNISKG